MEGPGENVTIDSVVLHEGGLDDRGAACDNSEAHNAGESDLLAPRPLDVHDKAEGQERQGEVREDGHGGCDVDGHLPDSGRQAHGVVD